MPKGSDHRTKQWVIYLNWIMALELCQNVEPSADLHQVMKKWLYRVFIEKVWKYSPQSFHFPISHHQDWNTKVISFFYCSKALQNSSIAPCFTLFSSSLLCMTVSHYSYWLHWPLDHQHSANPNTELWLKPVPDIWISSLTNLCNFVPYM